MEFDAAQATLGELIANLKPDYDVVITQNHKPVAKLVATSVVRQPRIPGLMKGKLTIIAEDDEYLDGFEEYMPRSCSSIRISPQRPIRPDANRPIHCGRCRARQF